MAYSEFNCLDFVMFTYILRTIMAMKVYCYYNDEIVINNISSPISFDIGLMSYHNEARGGNYLFFFVFEMFKLNEIELTSITLN